MYQQYFGLHELPFELTPNPKFLYLTPRHREALSTLQYCVASNKSLTVLIGEAGTGKTTLLRTVLESEDTRDALFVYLNNPLLTREDFVAMLAARFELGPRAARSKAIFLQALERNLVERRARNQRAVLVIDEAQSLSHDLLEEIRLLANIETSQEKLLLVILAGQPELAGRLNEPELRQLKQRIALRCEIVPFEVTETAAYMASRVRKAGGDLRLFTREAVLAIHEHARGIPRTINVMCDNALLGAFARGHRQVDREIVLEVVRDFDLGDQHTVEPPAVVEPEQVLTKVEAAEAPAEIVHAEPVVEGTVPQVSRFRRFAFLFGAARS